MVRSTHLAVLALFLVSVVSGGALAGIYEPATFPTSEEVQVTNNTELIRVSVENISSGNTATVEFAGIDAGGNETLEDSATLNTSGGSDVYEFSSVDDSTYGAYNVTVSGAFGAEFLEISRVDAFSGGGGVPISDSDAALVGGVLLLLGVVAWIGTRAESMGGFDVFRR